MAKIKAYNGNDPYIFISYSHDDNDVVLPIIEKLQEKYNVWFDDGIHLGEDYKKAIIQHINNCALFIYMVSINSLKSEFCKKEIKQAVRKFKPFFNVIIEDCLESEEAEEFMFDYENYQMSLLFNMDINDFLDDIERKAPAIAESKKIEEIKTENADKKIKIEVSPFVNDSSLETKSENNKKAKKTSSQINKFFLDSGIIAGCHSFIVGPSYTRYYIDMHITTSLSEIENCIPNLSYQLGGVNISFTKIVPGTSFSAIDIPNEKIDTIYLLRDVLPHLNNEENYPLEIGFGSDVSYKVITANINDLPHMLIGGATGSGKSVFIHSIITTLIARNDPNTVRLVLFDYKKVEFNLYKESPHLYCPIIDNKQAASSVLDNLIEEMKIRFNLFFKGSETSIFEYNLSHPTKKLPYLIIIFDEYADLIENDKEASQKILLLAQKARAAGIYLIISTQRPSVNVITGTLKANIPTHVSFLTSSVIDSMVLLDEVGAENLLGNGDMFVKCPSISRGAKTRLQAPYISTKEKKDIINATKEIYKINYLFDFNQKEENPKTTKVTDETYEIVKKWALTQEYVSISSIQRECCLGFNRSCKMFDQLVQDGIIEHTNSGPKGRRVIK